MTVQEIIERIVNYTNPEAQNCTSLYAWIDILENKILRDITPAFAKTEIPVVAGTSVYQLPEGISFYDIAKVTADGNILKEADLTEDDEGYYNAGGNMIGFTAAPAETIAVVHTLHSDGKTLVVPDAYADVYIWYILAMYEQSNNNIAAYNNYMLAFNNAVGEYKVSLQKRKNYGVAVSAV